MIATITDIPKRPQFDEWRKRENDLPELCKAIIGLSVQWDGKEFIKRDREKIEALYEFCASVGRLGAFDYGWREVTGDGLADDALCPKCKGMKMAP